MEDVFLLDEATIAAGMAFALERMKQLLEPAGAAALGALLTGRIPVREGETVCVVASGGNVDLAPPARHAGPGGAGLAPGAAGRAVARRPRATPAFASSVDNDGGRPPPPALLPPDATYDGG